MNIAEIETRLHQLAPRLNLHPSVADFAEAGRLLIEAKEHIAPSDWRNWLRRLSPPVAKSTANDWTRAAEIWDTLSEPIRRAGFLTLHQLLRGNRQARRAKRNALSLELASGVNDPKLTPEIICDDSLSWMRKQKANSVPFIVSDPPYGLGLKYDGWQEPSSPAAYWKWFSPYWRQMTRIIQPGGTILLWQGYKHLPNLFDWFPSCKVFAFTYITRGLHHWEPIVYWQKAGRQLVTHPGFNDWIDGSQKKVEGREYNGLHPCAKPVGDCRILVERYTLPGSLVLDPFCGVGSIPLACAQTGRKYLGIDRSQTYVDLARQRLASFLAGSVVEGARTLPPASSRGCAH